MTIASALVSQAFREGNLIPIGTAPNAAEAAEGLVLLNNYIFSVFGYEMGEELTDWQVPAPQRTSPVAANYPQLPFPTDIGGNIFPLPFGPTTSQAIYPFPPPNSRIVFGGWAVVGPGFKVYFPEQPNDGARMALIQGSGAGDMGVAGSQIVLDGNGRTIETANTKTYTDPVAARAWLYRADLGDWKAVLPLAAGDDCPFPPELDDLWITRVSMRLAPRFGKPVMSETQATSIMMMKTLKTRYRQAGVTVYGSQDFPRALSSYISGKWWW